MSSTSLSHSQGDIADGLGFELFHIQVGNEGANGGSHGCTMDLFKILTLEEEVGILSQNSSKVFICGIDTDILLGSRESCSSILWTMEIAGSAVTNVKIGKSLSLNYCRYSAFKEQLLKWM